MQIQDILQNKFIGLDMHRIICICLYSLIFSYPLAADDWNGVDYAQNSSVQLSHAERLLNSLSLTGSESILDIGCGDGKISEYNLL